MSILDGINEAISVYGDMNQEAKLTMTDIKNIMRDAGAPEEELAKLTTVPPEQCPSAELLTNSRKIEITARDITITPGS